MLRAHDWRLHRRGAGKETAGAGRARAPCRRSAAGSPTNAGSFSLTDRGANLSTTHFDARADGDDDPNTAPESDGHTDPEGAFGSGHRDRDAHARPHA
jgi:hypothetical protein